MMSPLRGDFLAMAVHEVNDIGRSASVVTMPNAA
jgi:hypothetical protein